MLNRLGIFDLFSYTLPGGIYLSALITALTLWPIAPAIPNLKLDASVLVILVTISYLIGLLVSPVKWTPWDRLFPSRKVETILEKLQHTYPEVTLKIRPDQWPVIQANTALEDREFSLSVDKLSQLFKITWTHLSRLSPWPNVVIPFTVKQVAFN